MKYLIFVSLFFGLLTACSLSEKLASDKKNSLPFWTMDLMDSIKKNDFRITFSSPKASITGIYIVKQMDGEWKGTLVNEFGLKVFDFVCSPKKCELLNVIPFLDKWYIKRTLASDIRFIMEIDNPNYKASVQSNRRFEQDTLIITYRKANELQRLPDRKIIYKNHKRELTYVLTKVNR